MPSYIFLTKDRNGNPVNKPTSKHNTSNHEGTYTICICNISYKVFARFLWFTRIFCCC